MHSCPDCGQACYCNGDIDDSEFDGPEDAECVCPCWADDDDESDDDYETVVPPAPAADPREETDHATP